MRMSTNPQLIQIGDDVIASDGEKIGTVTTVAQNYLVAEKGFFFLHDYYVPLNMIARYDESEEKVYLSVTKDEALASGWENEPTGDMYGSMNPLTDGAGTPMAAGMVGTVGASGDYSDVGISGDSATSSAARSGMGVETGRSNDSARKTDKDNIVVPVHEEDLIATKTSRQAGDVKVTRNVVEEERELDVPITEERVKVTRRTVDRAADTGDTKFTEDSFEVPVRTEDVNVDKVVRVAGEVEIEKERVQANKRVSGTIRKEVVDVDETGDVSSTMSEGETRGSTAL